MKCARKGGHGYRNGALIGGIIFAASSGITAAVAPSSTPAGKTVAVTASVITGGITGLIIGVIFYGAYRLITCNKL